MIFQNLLLLTPVISSKFSFKSIVLVKKYCTKFKKKQGESLDDLIVCDDILCVVLCVVLVIESSPTHAVLECLTLLETESPF